MTDRGPKSEHPVRRDRSDRSDRSEVLDKDSPARGSRGLDLGPERRLEGSTQSRMESALGHEFGAVRIHSGPEAASAASDVSAKAFTIGDHIAFGHGEYRPGRPDGDALLAHELAHVAQQRGGDRGGAPGPEDT